MGLISYFMLALSNATVSAAVLITGMLVFSGLGAFASERFLPRAPGVMPKIFLAIGALLIGYGLALDRPLDLIGTLPYGLRLVCCFALIFPPAFLMGFPMPTAMTSLARLGKDHMFLWAWGINGCFSVIGAAIVPIVATSFGLSAVLMIADLERKKSQGAALIDGKPAEQYFQDAIMAGRAANDAHDYDGQRASTIGREPVRQVGSYHVTARLHRGVTATITVEVRALGSA